MCRFVTLIFLIIMICVPTGAQETVTNIILAIDVSSSMGQKPNPNQQEVPLDILKRRFRECLDSMPQPVPNVILVPFSEQSQAAVRTTRIDLAEDFSRVVVKDGEWTNLVAGLKTAFKEAARLKAAHQASDTDDRHVSLIFLLTDGVQTVTPEGEKLPLDGNGKLLSRAPLRFYDGVKTEIQNSKLVAGEDFYLWYASIGGVTDQSLSQFLTSPILNVGSEQKRLNQDWRFSWLQARPYKLDFTDPELRRDGSLLFAKRIEFEGNGGTLKFVPRVLPSGVTISLPEGQKDEIAIPAELDKPASVEVRLVVSGLTNEIPKTETTELFEVTSPDANSLMIAKPRTLMGSFSLEGFEQGLNWEIQNNGVLSISREGNQSVPLTVSFQTDSIPLGETIPVQLKITSNRANAPDLLGFEETFSLKRTNNTSTVHTVNVSLSSKREGYDGEDWDYTVKVNSEHPSIRYTSTETLSIHIGERSPLRFRDVNPKVPGTITRNTRSWPFSIAGTAPAGLDLPINDLDFSFSIQDGRLQTGKVIEKENESGDGLAFELSPPMILDRLQLPENGDANLNLVFSHRKQVARPGANSGSGVDDSVAFAESDYRDEVSVQVRVIEPGLKSISLVRDDETIEPNEQGVHSFQTGESVFGTIGENTSDVLRSDWQTESVRKRLIVVSNLLKSQQPGNISSGELANWLEVADSSDESVQAFDITNAQRVEIPTLQTAGRYGVFAVYEYRQRQTEIIFREVTEIIVCDVVNPIPAWAWLLGFAVFVPTCYLGWSAFSRNANGDITNQRLKVRGDSCRFAGNRNEAVLNAWPSKPWVRFITPYQWHSFIVEPRIQDGEKYPTTIRVRRVDDRKIAVRYEDGTLVYLEGKERGGECTASTPFKFNAKDAETATKLNRITPRLKFSWAIPENR